MAAPTVIGRTTSVTNSPGSTSHTVALPNGISTGELLIAGIGIDNLSGITFTWPTGWGVIANGPGNATGRSIGQLAYREVDGTEGFTGTGDTITVTSSSADEAAHVSLLISGHEDPGTQAPEGAAVGGDSTTPNPPSLTPTGGSKDYLWLVFFNSRNGADATAYPTNYSNGQYNIADIGGDNASMGSAERALTAASEDPGTFTIDVSRPWSAYTVAVHPVGAGFDPANLDASVLGDDVTLTWDV